MSKWNYIGRLLAVVIFGGMIWLLHPANDQVKELASQLDKQYISANKILLSRVEELIEWDFSQPLTVENEVYFTKLFNEFYDVKELFFSGTPVHHEWRDRLSDLQLYMSKYERTVALSEEEIADIYQVLQATRFISRDFIEFRNRRGFNFYEAMNSEKHEMVERVKSRLEMNY